MVRSRFEGLGSSSPGNPRLTSENESFLAREDQVSSQDRLQLVLRAFVEGHQDFRYDRGPTQENLVSNGGPHSSVAQPQQ